MKRAMIFPGQGSQKIGMGKELVDIYPAAKQVFEEVDDALNLNLSSIIWNGRLEELTLTENAQPALMASSMAILAALESEGLDVSSFDFMAGHSLGEYSALCAAKSITLADTARLLRRRGSAMQSCVKPSDGAMAAILGLSAEQIVNLLLDFTSDGVCQIANDNDPRQVVVSGHRSAVEAFIELTTKNGARRAMLLNVSAPFHCSIMSPAAEIMRESLEGIEILKPKVPIVMNTRADTVIEPELIRVLLVDQIVGLVRWRETLTYISSTGPSKFFEIGVGRVLSGMVKRTVPEAEAVGVSSYQDILEIIESENYANIKK